MNNSPLIRYYETAAAWLDAKPTQERILLGSAFLAVIFLLWSLLIQSGYDKQRDEYLAQLNQLQTEQKTTQDQMTALASALATGPAKTKQLEINQLQQELQQLQIKLSEVGQGLIRGDQLPGALQAVFSKTQGLELVSIQTLPTSEMNIAYPKNTEENTQQQASTSSQDMGSGVYKQVVVLKLRGDFFHVLNLIKVLESLEWKFYWESLDYSVVKYPQAEIELRVFTLSAEEGLLGV